MNKEICSHLRLKLADLPFADVIAGMAQTVQIIDQGGDMDNPTKVITRIPVAYDTNDADPLNCHPSPERELVPDSNKKSIIYFEDYGLSPVSTSARGTSIQSRVRLICWLNRARLVGNAYTDITARCMGEIMNRLNTVNPENSAPFTKMVTRITSIPPQAAELFSRYTYDENVRQYLRPPYEFFGLDLTTTFDLSTNCLESIQWDQSACY